NFGFFHHASHENKQGNCRQNPVFQHSAKDTAGDQREGSSGNVLQQHEHYSQTNQRKSHGVACKDRSDQRYKHHKWQGVSHDSFPSTSSWTRPSISKPILYNTRPKPANRRRALPIGNTSLTKYRSTSPPTFD